jgi:hypothetical protein
MQFYGIYYFVLAKFHSYKDPLFRQLDGAAPRDVQILLGPLIRILGGATINLYIFQNLSSLIL